MKTFIALAFLAVSAIFLIVGIAQPDMQQRGIAIIELEIPDVLRRTSAQEVEGLKLPKKLDVPKNVGIPDIPDMSDFQDLPNVPDSQDLPDIHVPPKVSTFVEDAATKLATRVSQGIAEATEIAESVLEHIPDQIWLGTKQVCLEGPEGFALLWRSRKLSSVEAVQNAVLSADVEALLVMWIPPHLLYITFHAPPWYRSVRCSHVCGDDCTIIRAREQQRSLSRVP